MTSPRKFTLCPDQEQPGWSLTDDATHRVVSRFPSKRLATRRGALEHAIGEEGGCVRIQIGNGVVEEQRTYPRWEPLPSRSAPALTAPAP